MKKLFVSFLAMLLMLAVMTLSAQTYNTAVHLVPGGAELVAESGGTITVKSGGTLALDSGATFTNATPLTQSGAATFTGNAYFGAAGYKSTMTAASGAWAFTGALTANGGISGTTGALSSTLDVDGNAYFGAAGYISTVTASNGNWAITGSVTSLGALAGTTLNTGQGAYELYKMDQNVDTAAAPAFLGVSVSTSATSSVACKFKGAYVTLPTSSANECDMAYQTSDHALYIATETVTGATSWKAVW